MKSGIYQITNKIKLEKAIKLYKNKFLIKEITKLTGISDKVLWYHTSKRSRKFKK